jgi:predicted lipid-binding transport protein (Tim44 family)
MTEIPQFLDIVIFAMVAVFLGLRLRSVLGRRNADQTPPPVSGSVIDLNPRRPTSLETVPADPLAAGLARIKAADPSFDADQFLHGAGLAFEMIVKAFAAGDQATLQPLLSDKVFADFSAAITARANDPEDHRMEFVRLVSATLSEAQLAAGSAEISVRFVSEQRTGDGTEVRLIDLWRFARSAGARDPNWRLVATGSLDA